jgi:hypothetical protein
MIKKLKHITGIKGIQLFLNGRANDKGWHLFLDGEYKEFYDMSVFSISDYLNETNINDIILVGWAGNGIYFTSDATVTDWN